MGEINERNCGKNPCSAICEANTDIREMFGRKRVNKNVHTVLQYLAIAIAVSLLS